MNVRGLPCEYCRVRPAGNADHVVPKARLATAIKEHTMGIRAIDPLKDAPDWLRDTIPSCFQCNTKKATRLLAPPSWKSRIKRLNKIGLGTFQVWDGGRLPEVVR